MTPLYSNRVAPNIMYNDLTERALRASTAKRKIYAQMKEGPRPSPEHAAYLTNWWNKRRKKNPEVVAAVGLYPEKT